MADREIAHPPTNVAGYDPLRLAADCRWDGVAAAQAVDFFPIFLTHHKAHKGQFTLEQWQSDIIATLFGWKRPDGTRRYRESIIAVPRKNGKTTIGAGLALYLLLCDSEPGAEVYSAAFSREQASLVFEPAAHMVRNSPPLDKRCKVMTSQKRIVHMQAGAKYVAIPAEVASTHGFNAHAVIFDELHTQKSRDLYDVLKTSMGARRQPLFASITTAGHDRHSICWEVWEYARKVRDGIVDDPYFLPVIYELDQEADWSDRDNWRAVNPNYGVSIGEEYLIEAYQRACEIPAQENTFRNLHLNQWTEQAVRWFSREAWDKCSGDAEIPYGGEVWCGLDLSATTDLSALVMVHPRSDGTFATRSHFWVPREAAEQRARRDRVPYMQWIDEQHITATTGSSVDYDVIRRDIHAMAERYTMRTIAIDRWNANQLAHQLEADGLSVGAFGQGYASMSSPSKLLEGLILDKQLEHDNNPVQNWCASNVALEGPDAAGNIKPSKKASTERIDGIVALIMALGVWAIEQESQVWSAEEIGL